MNITEQIENSITQFSVNSEGSLLAQAAFASDFSGFDGHFPQQAILPGICQIELCRILGQQYNNMPLVLKETKLAKFFSPIMQNEKIEISMTTKNNFRWEADITCNGEKKAQIVIMLEKK